MSRVILAASSCADLMLGGASLFQPDSAALGVSLVLVGVAASAVFFFGTMAAEALEQPEQLARLNEVRVDDRTAR
jgi:hypothetical protein